ncbi:MAG TPA: ferritin family protein, partial [Terracidiphilus sp.]|nr:ferritin family protein [Terracidiphilus sp.]
MVSAEDEVAVKNLVAAFDNEMSAHARNLAFAGKADEEGLGGIASLFRASARAEQIHADNHARVIRHMGGDIDA